MSVRVLGAAETPRGSKTVRHRRSYTAEQKRRLVEETLQPGASVSVVARRHEINANLLFTWRRQLRAGGIDPVVAGAPAPTQFISLGVVGGDTDKTAAVAESAPPAAGLAEIRPAARPERGRPSRRGSVIEIELPNGARSRVDDLIDVAVLRQIVATLKDAL